LYGTGAKNELRSTRAGEYLPKATAQTLIRPCVSWDNFSVASHLNTHHDREYIGPQDVVNEPMRIPPATTPRRQCFVSYAHHDHKACDRIVVHLKAIGRALGFSIWTDHKLRAGNRWSARLSREIEQSSIFALLVTNDFLASDYIQEHELPAIRLQRDDRNALVVPIVLRESGWQYLCDRYVQAIPHGASKKVVPCFNWADPEKAFAISADEVGKAAIDWFGLDPVSPFAPKVPA
jgi:hypothetical protein